MRVAGFACMFILAIAGCEGDIGESSPGPGTDAGAQPPASVPDGGAADDAGSGGGAPDPFAVAPTCTSGSMWTQGNHGSAEMNPGRACIACHSTGDGPDLTVAGTVYPTAHEPDLCNGANGSDVVITIVGADGQSLTLAPNKVGNFNSKTRVALPYTAKVAYMGRERAMGAMQTSGDCNSCHTQSGANGAPGRILLP